MALGGRTKADPKFAAKMRADNLGIGSNVKIFTAASMNHGKPPG